MFSSSKLRPAPRQNEGGYILLTLLLTMALMVIFAAAIVPTIKFEIERDREEELIHRGVQYSRAIRAYYKKFGRYPAKLEDLENTSNMKFLRKRYKDPVTGQNFKLLHFGEVKLMFGGGVIPGASTLGTPVAGLTSGAGSQNSIFAANGGAGSNSNSNSAANQNGTASDASQTTSDAADSKGTDNTDGTKSGDGSSGSQAPGDNLGSGMPIVGVTSFSKKETIREFNHKRKYNEWQFIYDPSTDRGGLLMTPNQPPLLQSPTQNGNGQNGMNGITGGFGGGGNSFGNSNTYGTGAPGVTNNPSPPASGQPGSGDPNNPPQ